MALGLIIEVYYCMVDFPIPDILSHDAKWTSIILSLR